MNYRIVWSAPVEKKLTDSYLDARADGLADQFTAAVDRLERALALDPLEAGESREGEDRIAIDWPVVLWYRIDEPVRAVAIVSVRYAR
jgi:hypothetical protein